jgi:hypothetical protein
MPAGRKGLVVSTCHPIPHGRPSQAGVRRAANSIVHEQTSPLQATAPKLQAYAKPDPTEQACHKIDLKGYPAGIPKTFRGVVKFYP